MHYKSINKLKTNTCKTMKKTPAVVGFTQLGNEAPLVKETTI
jgi:hypothetical protein